MFRQLFLFMLLGVLSCTSPDPLEEVKEWSFALSNPVVSPYGKESLKAGDRLFISMDTLFVTNEFSLLEKKLPITDDPEQLPDSTDAFTIGPGFGKTLRVSHFYGKELRNEWLFEPSRSDLKPVPSGGLTGKSFYVGFPGEDSLRVYFDYGDAVRTRNRKENEYYVSSDTNTFVPHSRTMSRNMGHMFSAGYSATLMRGYSLYRRFVSGQAGFDRHEYVYGLRENGTPVASYIDDENGTYRRVDLPLRPAPPVLPEDVSPTDFANRINTGLILIDDNYPRIDSALVSYFHTDDFYRYGGLDYDELSELEITLNEQGEFILFSRGRVVKLYQWELSKDRSYVHLFHKDNYYGNLYLPILSWDDEAVTFRMPLKVKTREPRGMELESYGNLDAFVRVEAVAAATLNK